MLWNNYGGISSYSSSSDSSAFSATSSFVPINNFWGDIDRIKHYESDGSNNYDPWVDPYANPDSNGDGLNDADYPPYTLPNLVPPPVQLDQLGSCVSFAISYVSNYLGQLTNPFRVALSIDNLLGFAPNGLLGTAYTQGLLPAQATQAINSFFYTTPISNIAEATAALTQNIPIIANFITGHTLEANGNITITAHEVVIVGFNEWNYYVADSLTGTNHWVSQDLITFQNGAYAITGVRP